jgi:NO-binding membrane sensor protein with MHYT domain
MGETMTSTDLTLVGSYDYQLVGLSFVIAILASYAALDLARRVTVARGRVRLLWLTGCWPSAYRLSCSMTGRRL